MEEEGDGAMKSECKGVTGWLFGHKYRPRHDRQKGPIPNTIDRISGACPEAIDALMPTKETYVCDVCERCGDIIERKPEATL